MEIKLRQTCGYIGCRVITNRATIELGLLDAEEAAALSRELLSASIELQEYVDDKKKSLDV